jgi:glycogen debranching enzyme
VPPHPPSLHDAIICVEAPTVAVSSPDGQITGHGAAGVFQHDRRILERLVLHIDGADPEPLSAHLAGAGGARFVGIVHYPAHGPDPALVVDRRRDAGGLRERFVIRNHQRETARFTVEITAQCDLAHVIAVKDGHADRDPIPPVAEPGGLAWRSGRDAASVSLTAAPRAHRTDPASGLLGWDVTLDPGALWGLELTLDASLAAEAPPGRSEAPWRPPRVQSTDHRLGALVERAVLDLQSLVLPDPEHTSDRFITAGAPWFLTLFGRDSLWAARMLLPLGTDLAAGTLRALARRQGRHLDAGTEEAPGKILHELRREATPPGASVSLPPRYYGTVDATPLWVSLLYEAWQWGMPEEEVAPLLPAAERALCWMRDHGDADGDGFLEYLSQRPGGLANQGWKDSADGIQFADGALASPPVALSEVQGYAYEAAVRGAALLEAFDRPGADEWRAWAQALRRRFRDQFWLDGADDPYVAVALDSHKKPVDAVASNMGHLPGTGILTPEECAAVARRLTREDMLTPYGVRTMSTRAAGFNPFGYHTGSVWPHDTAIIAASLARAGHGAEAVRMLDGLVRAAPSFDYRLPELYGGYPVTGREDGRGLAPYPHACAPQAWSAAAAVVLVQCALGIQPSVPGGELRVVPPTPLPWGDLDVAGLRVAGTPLSVRVSGTGAVEVVECDPALTVRAGSRSTGDPAGAGGRAAAP